MPAARTKKANGTSRGTHGGDCPTCGKYFPRSGDLKRHIQTHVPHSERPYACKICKKRFVQKTALSTHMNVHTGATPFACKVGGCGKTFNDPSSRSRHKREAHCKHPGYKCPVAGCKSQIKRRSAFVKHMERKHDRSPTSDEVDKMVAVKVKREETPEDDGFASPAPALPIILESPSSPIAQPSLLLSVPLISFTPSRTSSPVSSNYFGDAPTPDLSGSLSSISSSRSPSVLSSPGSGTPELVPDSTYVAPSNEIPEFHDLMPTAMPSFNEELSKDTDPCSFGFESDPASTSWDDSMAFLDVPLADDHFALHSDFTPLSELSLSTSGPSEDSATLQGLYYDTIPHSLSAAWSQT